MFVIAKPKSKTEFVQSLNTNDYGSLQSALIFSTITEAKECTVEKGEKVYEVEQVYKLKKV